MKKISTIVSTILFFFVFLLLPFPALHAEWQNIKMPVQSQLFTSGAVMPDGKIVLLSDMNKIIVSDDKFENWITISEFKANYTTYFFNTDNKGNIFYSPYNSSTGDIIISKLDYSNKEETTILEDNIYIVNVQPIPNTNEIMAIGVVGNNEETVFLKSYNNLSSWEIYTIDIADGKGAVAIQAINEQTFIALSVSGQSIPEPTGQIIKTTDGGKTWNTLFSAKNVRMQNLYFYDDSFGIICGNQGTLYRTTDGGNTWENIFSSSSFPNSSFSFTRIHFFDKNRILMTGVDQRTNPAKGTIFYSEDGGLKWKIVHQVSASASSTLYPICVIGEDIYCFGRGGIMVKGSTNDLITSITEPTTLRNNLLYPNPADNTTTLSFDLLQPSHVDISVQDVLGNRIMNIYSSFTTSEAFTQPIHTQSLPNGMYNIIININGKVKIEKLMINR